MDVIPQDAVLLPFVFILYDLIPSLPDLELTNTARLASEPQALTCFFLFGNEIRSERHRAQLIFLTPMLELKLISPDLYGNT